MRAAWGDCMWEDGLASVRLVLTQAIRKQETEGLVSLRPAVSEVGTAGGEAAPVT